MTVDDLLDRVRVWFVHYHRDDWAAADRPPDMHLYFPANGQRALMMIGDDWQPPQGVTIGRFGVLQKEPDRGFACAPTAGLDFPSATHEDRIMRYVGLNGSLSVRTGVWFRLRREPEPRTTLGPLLTEIDAAAGQGLGWAASELRKRFGAKLRKGSDPVVLALGYPDTDGLEQWLFLKVKPSHAKGLRWTDLETLNHLAVESFETAPAGRDALLRRTGHIARALEGRRVLVFGQGALGGHVTRLLAQAGLPYQHTVDHDRVRPGNVVRHVAGLIWVGTPKTIAVRSEALNHAPNAEIRTSETSWDPELIAIWTQEADVIVDTTANPSFSLLLNEICLRLGRKAVYAATHRRAAVGRIRVVRPRRDACLVCYEAGYLHSATYPLIPPGDEGPFVEAGCGVQSTEASAVDIESVANWTARVVLNLLQEKVADDNHCLVVNDIIPEGADVLARVGVQWSRWLPIPGCEACGGLGEAQ